MFIDLSDNSETSNTQKNVIPSPKILKQYKSKRKSVKKYIKYDKTLHC